MDTSFSRELLRIAKDVLHRTTLTFKDSPKSEDKARNSVHFEVQRFVDRVRRNEKMDTFLNRQDSDDEMALEVGLSEHKAIDAIVREILSIAKKLAKKNDLTMKKS